MLRVAVARLYAAELLPPPVPETAEQARWAERSLTRRVGTALLATLLLGGVLVGLDQLRPILVPANGQQGTPWRALLLQGPVVLGVLLIVRALIEKRASVALQWRGAGTSLALALPVLLLALTDLTPGGTPTLGTVLANVTLGIVVGCTEELYGRGLLVTVLGGPRHMALAVVLSSVLFAYLHMPQYLHYHGLAGALLRCAGSSAFAATFALIRLRSGSLVGPIVFHAINNSQNVFSGAPHVPPELMHISARPVLIGGALTAIYWLACRRAINHSAQPRDGLLV